MGKKQPEISELEKRTKEFNQAFSKCMIVLLEIMTKFFSSVANTLKKQIPVDAEELELIDE